VRAAGIRRGIEPEIAAKSNLRADRCGEASRSRRCKREFSKQLVFVILGD
jgi:hypothetical protein